MTRISFEFFPPKTEAMEKTLLQTARDLVVYQPEFVSVTYGAGGSTRDRTHDLVIHLYEKYGLNVAAHLTCVDSSAQDVDAIATQYWRQGIKHIVALRGDPADTSRAYRPHPQGYAFARDLVEGLRRIRSCQISVAAYPETHPEATSPEADLDNLKRKLDAGASQAITQFFLDTDSFMRFRDRAARAGIESPIIPGILPIMNFPRACEFAARCGAAVPASVLQRFENCAPNTPEHHAAALAFGTEQLERLASAGVEDFHFYTLNRTDVLIPLCDTLKTDR